MTQPEIGNNINISPETLQIPEEKNKSPELNFSVSTLSNHIRSKVSLSLDEIPDFNTVSNKVTSSLNELKNKFNETKENTIDETSLTIEKVINTYKDAPNLVEKLTDFIGKLPKSTYDNMKLAVNNFQKNGDLQAKISNISKSLGVDPYIICGVCTQETKFDATLVSPKGAKGLMQLMPNTERGIRNFIERGSKVNAGPEEKFYALLRDNKTFMEMYKNTDSSIQNLAIGSAFLAYLSTKFGGNMEAILSYYNGGGSSAAKNSKENQSYAPGALSYAKLFQQMNIFPTT